MAGTLNRLRFYCITDLSSFEVDYAPPLSDYPEYPREAATTYFFDQYKSALGSNYWTYFKGQVSEWKFNWVEVSEDAMATMGMIVGSSRSLSPHIVIFEAQGIDTPGLGSLLASVAPVGTYFCSDVRWEPKEVNFGLWNFETTFIKEG